MIGKAKLEYKKKNNKEKILRDVIMPGVRSGKLSSTESPSQSSRPLVTGNDTFIFLERFDQELGTYQPEYHDICS